MDGPIMFPIKRPNGIAMVMISEKEWQSNKDPEKLSRLLEVRVASAIERADVHVGYPGWDMQTK
jgi:PHD/YefM family antitoxin component YafN of YafNO toxin-antitoxin module